MSKEERIHDFFEQLIASYNGVKEVRRELRKIGLTRKKRNPENLSQGVASAYMEQMKKLGKRQLELESLKNKVECLPELSNDEFQENLDVMQKYIRKILSENEGIQCKLLNNETVMFDDLNHLDEFTDSIDGESKGTKYRMNEDFSQQFHKTKRLVASSLKKSEALNSYEENIEQREHFWSFLAHPYLKGIGVIAAIIFGLVTVYTKFLGGTTQEPQAVDAEVVGSTHGHKPTQGVNSNSNKACDPYKMKSRQEYQQCKKTQQENEQ